MIYNWESTAALAAVRDEQADAPFSLSGDGLWVCLLSSGSCTAGLEDSPGALPPLPPKTVGAGGLILSRGPLRVVPAADGCHLLSLLLTGSAPAQLLAGLPGMPFFARGESCPGAAELMDRLAGEEGASSRVRSQLVFALLCELASADSAAPPLPPLAAAAIEDIRQNYAGLYGVEELSERLGVSKSHLIRVFTAAVGISPGRYLTGVRIEAAMKLLLHREYSLDVVASLCGFSGANYLCRVFKKETGQTPAQWRAAATRSGVADLTAEEKSREQAMFI